jgi:transcriptional regulator with XRE-family HTH domain
VPYGELLTALVKSQLPWRITRFRELRGFTQAALSKKCGLAPSTISQIERGIFKGLRFQTIVKLAAIFEVSLDHMTGIDHAQLVRSASVVGRVCPECGKCEGHSVAECALEMFERGRSHAFISARHRLTIPTVELMLREEMRMKRERPVRAKEPNGPSM